MVHRAPQDCIFDFLATEQTIFALDADQTPMK
jgi:hypothetical protein